MFFAQKIRQLKTIERSKNGGKKQKIGDMMREIKAMWKALTVEEKKGYEKKAVDITEY